MTDSLRGGLTLLTLTLCVLCSVCVAPALAQEQSEVITLNIDPPEFTMLDHSIGCGYYIPWYTRIHFNIDGTATITLPNTTRIYINPKTTDDPDATVTRIFEVPNGAGAFPGDDNSLTITFNDNPILWITLDPGLSTKPNPNHPTPTTLIAKDDSWIEYAILSPQQHTTYQSFTTRWPVPLKPLKTKSYPDPDTPSRGHGSIFYIFNGFESKTHAVMPDGFKSGIVQPILIWNCGDLHKRDQKETCSGYPKTEQWSIAAWADFPAASVHGNLAPTEPGHTIEGKVEWNARTSTWTITITDLNSGWFGWFKGTSQLNNIKMIPNDSDLIEPVIVLENYMTSLICKNGKFKEQWPPSDIVFTNFDLRDTKGINLTPNSQIQADYNKLRFEDKNRNKLCEEESNFPRYDPNQYYVDIRNWPNNVTFKIPTKIPTKSTDL